jgi:CDP-diacylglycerol--glycerol-3-phosphate 3-phosphatidyltransferase
MTFWRNNVEVNLANKLTIIRLALVPIFILFLSYKNLWARWVSLIAFITAAVTDLLDGRAARKERGVTEVGKILDPLADKILICSAFIYFVGMPELNIPPWMVILIITREFSITGLRLLAASKGRTVSVSHFGKAKTISQMLVVIAILLIVILQEGESLRRSSFTIKAPYLLMLAITLLTLLSGVNYIYKHRSLFLG